MSQTLQAQASATLPTGGSTAVILSYVQGQETQKDLLVPPESYLKSLNVGVVKMSLSCPSLTGNRVPCGKGKLQRVSGEEHWLRVTVPQALMLPFTSCVLLAHLVSMLSCPLTVGTDT